MTLSAADQHRIDDRVLAISRLGEDGADLFVRAPRLEPRLALSAVWLGRPWRLGLHRYAGGQWTLLVGPVAVQRWQMAEVRHSA